jgi:DnaJ-class molecular chaperone with C-terminal Zn finger domain
LDSRGYYAILEVSERASFQEIKRSYRKLARKYHPDRNAASGAEETIKKINQAFEVLSNREKRRQYDSDILLTEFVPNNQEQTPNDLHESSSVGSQNSSVGYFKHSNKFWNRASNNATDNTRTMLDTPKSRFHITIEPSLCLAFGGCESIAPRVFVVDKNKRINPKAKVESETGDNLERILLAAQACPTKAIKIIDRYTGDQIYP